MPTKQNSARRARTSDGKAKRNLDRIVETIIYLATEARRLSRESAASIGLTPTQVTALKTLHTIGDMSLSGLSSELKAKNSTVTGIVDRMERDNLVVRERSDSDRRVWFIRLTPHGAELASRIEVTPWDILFSAVDALSPRQRSQLLSILGRIAEHVRKQVVGEDQAGRKPARRRRNV